MKISGWSQASISAILEPMLQPSTTAPPVTPSSASTPRTSLPMSASVNGVRGLAERPQPRRSMASVRKRAENRSTW